jgi:hypothetical protein
VKLTHFYAVEFVGGPFDGHKHVSPVLPRQRTETLALPINAEVLGVLDGSRRIAPAPVTSVAWYCLELDQGTWRYCFQGSTPPARQPSAKTPN